MSPFSLLCVGGLQKIAKSVKTSAKSVGSLHKFREIILTSAKRVGGL